jgi:hypothetical protein
MSSPQYDLAVAYRIYPGVSKVPPVFPRDKYRLAALCLESFKRSLGSLRVKLWILFDGCPPEYHRLFASHFPPEDIEFIPLAGIGNTKTFGMQLEILAGQDSADLVYFAEDDYFYLPKGIETMCRFLRNNPRVHFVTPYDHPNAYSAPLEPELISTFANLHWRTVVSSCLTFLTTTSTLRRTRKTFESYTRGNSDYALWMSLTKYRLHVFNPVRYRIPSERAAVSAAWHHCWRQLLFGTRYELWSPVPSIATHMESNHLAPVLEWQKHWATEVGQELEQPSD